MYTKEQKQEYFTQLRERWNRAKELSKDDEVVSAWNEAQETCGMKFSLNSFAFVRAEMQVLGLEGIPYVDCKTYQGWLKSGFQVKKGEKSLLSGITWIGKGKDDDDEGYIFPKEYKLFHKSQVEEI